MLSVVLVPAGLWFLVWLARKAFQCTREQTASLRQTRPESHRWSIELGYCWAIIQTGALNKLPPAILRCLTREKPKPTLPLHGDDHSPKRSSARAAAFYDFGALLGLCGVVASLALLLISSYSLLKATFGPASSPSLVTEPSIVGSLQKRFIPALAKKPAATSELTLKPLVRSRS
jgi:hypothetical protein